MKLQDDLMWSKVRGTPNIGVPFYLMASYAYYELDTPFLSDAAFDELAKFLLERWPTITHRHREYLDEDGLRAGTRPKGYPEIAKDAARSLIEKPQRRSRRT